MTNRPSGRDSASAGSAIWNRPRRPSRTTPSRAAERWAGMAGTLPARTIIGLATAYIFNQTEAAYTS